MLRETLVIAAAIIAIPFVVALFIQKDYLVTRTITIDRSMLRFLIMLTI
jgi:hypothetical protein